MSFLAPLYVLGALGIGLPILFHLIKRQPRGQRVFSSLMFLNPSPPTVTRRSRLDNLPLLLLRAFALLLLAAAFARPYLRSASQTINATPGKRLVLLIDTSASMRRADLWEQAQRKANQLVATLEVADQLAIVSFDSKPRNQLAFEQSAALEPNARREAAKQAIQDLKPTWAASDLASALIFASDLLTTQEAPSSPESDESATPIDQAGSIVVISDMQTGGEENLKGLQAYSWPKGIKAEVFTVTTERKTNASAIVLTPRDDDPASTAGNAASSEVTDSNSMQRDSRVRIVNSSDATRADFTVLWQSASGTSIETTRIPVHVGPGESRVIRMPEPPASIADTSRMKLVLEGDDHGFDNTVFVARPKPVEQQLLFVGSEVAEPRDSLGYYLERAPLDNRRRVVKVQAVKADALPAELDPKQTPLVIVAAVTSDADTDRLKRYVSNGGQFLWVVEKGVDAEGAQKALRLLSDSPDLAISEGAVKDYAMWSRIDFQHPLFARFADPRYNDFTKIRFWSYRKIQGLSEDWNSVVSFDNGDVALAQKSIAKGQLWILAAGWQPRDSQLALSTKFVPLLDGFFSYSSPQKLTSEQYAIGSPLPFAPSPTAQIESDGQQAIQFRTSDDGETVDEPGFYRFVEGESAQEFAVNVPPSESITQPLQSDELERYGVQLGAHDGADLVEANQRQQKDVELEGRQRLWRWILLGVLGLIAMESALSGYLRRRTVSTSGID
jgi:hypothetical protein